MEKKLLLLGVWALCGIVILASCKKIDGTVNNGITGYLYTTTNGEGINQVVKFSRNGDGVLSNETAYPTNSNGGANASAGGAAHGDFDSQGGLQIIGNYLLNVNAGGNQVSVFSLDRKTGNLTFKNNVSSGGTRPVSIAYTKKAGSADEYWLVVGNQWGNPNVQGDGDTIKRYPNNAFFEQNLTLPDESDNQRNIQLFSFNSTTGILTTEKQLDTYVRENGGPTTVSFSSDGTKLAVSTWGIANFNTMSPSLNEQRPSRVYVYDFANGVISGKRYFEETGIAGTIGFNWARASNTKLYVSNFNLIVAKENNSLTVLTDDGSTVTKSANSVTSPAAINESCWTTLNPAGNELYVASFHTNLVSAFNIDGSGLTLTASVPRTGLAPTGDSKEIWVTPDNRFLYNLGALLSFSINQFDITASSLSYKKQYFLTTTASGAGMPGKYNFLGLMGFDIDQTIIK